MHDAVKWAMKQEGIYVEGDINRHKLVELVRGYLNKNEIDYNTFSYDDLLPLLN